MQIRKYDHYISEFFFSFNFDLTINNMLRKCDKFVIISRKLIIIWGHHRFLCTIVIWFVRIKIYI
jgi:hypothetical protein